jgi:fructose-bisphosphate aldolase class I
MRARIITSPAFRGDRIIGAILFEGTMEREIDGIDSAEYLWNKKIVPFVKVDQGLADEADGVQLMKPLTRLGNLLDRAAARGIFGTKMRSVVKDANPEGIDRVLDQQFEVAKEIWDVGLLPIIEPEVDIHSSSRAEADELLVAGIHRRLDGLPWGAQVALKLSLPARPGHYSKLVQHAAVVRVLALSGGYSRYEAVAVLAENLGVIASFSRALLQGLSAAQSAAEFDAALLETVEAIYLASTT